MINKEATNYKLIQVQMTTKKHFDKLQNCNPADAWKQITGGKEEMDEQSFSLFITQTLRLPEDSLLQFYILTIGMKTPKLGHIKFQNFEQIFRFSGQCKTIKDFKKLLPKLQKDLLDPKIFKQMYKSIFEAFLIKNLSMEFQFAESLWTILLAKEFRYMKEFQQYLSFLGNKKPTKCHKDLWNMLYEFAVTIKDVKKDYKQGDAWPVFLDSFVQYMRENNLV